MMLQLLTLSLLSSFVLTIMSSTVSLLRWLVILSRTVFISLLCITTSVCQLDRWRLIQISSKFHMVVVHVRPPLTIYVMINSCKSTKAINSFQYVAIPSPRDVFARYGERLSDKGTYSCGVEGGSPQMVSSSSVIDQLISAQNLLEADMAAQPNK